MKASKKGLIGTSIGAAVCLCLFLMVGARDFPTLIGALLLGGFYGFGFAFSGGIIRKCKSVIQLDFFLGSGLIMAFIIAFAWFFGVFIGIKAIICEINDSRKIAQY